MLSEKKILNETKNHNPPLQVKWSVPNDLWNFNFSASWSKQKQNVFHWSLISCHYIFPTHKYIILIDLYKCIISHCENLYPFQIKNNNKQNTFYFFTWAKLGPVYALMERTRSSSFLYLCEEELFGRSPTSSLSKEKVV